MHPAAARPSTRQLAFSLSRTRPVSFLAAGSGRGLGVGRCLQQIGGVAPQPLLRLYSSGPPPKPPLGGESPLHSTRRDDQVSSNTPPSSTSTSPASSPPSPPPPPPSSFPTSSSPTPPGLDPNAITPPPNTGPPPSPPREPHDPQHGRHHEQPPPRHHPLPSVLQNTLSAHKDTLATHASRLLDVLSTRMLNTSHTLNSLTGYTPIERIKAENETLESRLSELQGRVRLARTAYKTSNARRASTQREVTALLARKEGWTPADLERFTSLYRADHTLEHEVAATSQTLADVEVEEQAVAARLNQGILRRYHEEQIWSDRIRRASTWGTWGLMGVNVLLFLVLQFVAEPWRRRRLVRGVVEEERGALDDLRGQLEEVRAVLARREQRDRKEDERREMAEREMMVLEQTALDMLHSERGRDQGRHQRREDQGQHQRRDTPTQRDEGAGFPDVRAALRAAEGNRARPPSVPWRKLLAQPARYCAPILRDLVSERRVDLRMRDASLIALEGAAAGAALAGGIIALVFAMRW